MPLDRAFRELQPRHKDHGGWFRKTGTPLKIYEKLRIFRAFENSNFRNSCQMAQKHARIVENGRLSGRNEISFVIGRNRNFLRIFENLPTVKTLKIRRKFLFEKNLTA